MKFLMLKICSNHITTITKFQSIIHILCATFIACIISTSTAFAIDYKIPLKGVGGDPDMTFFGYALGVKSQRCSPTTECNLDIQEILDGRKVRFTETIIPLSQMPAWLASKSDYDLKVVVSMFEDGKIVGLKFVFGSAARNPKDAADFLKMIETEVSKKMGVEGKRTMSSKNIWGTKIKNYSVRWRKPWGYAQFMPEDEVASSPFVKDETTLYIESTELENLWNKELENRAKKSKNTEDNRTKM